MTRPQVIVRRLMLGVGVLATVATVIFGTIKYVEMIISESLR